MATPPADAEARRFTLELEFVQMLANPAYVQFLAQEGYFGHPPFMRWLDYLQHWRSPERARFLLYPAALTVLELLVTDAEFRAAASGPAFGPYVNGALARALGPAAAAGTGGASTAGGAAAAQAPAPPAAAATRVG